MLHDCDIGNLFETHVANIKKQYDKNNEYIKTQKKDKWLNEISIVDARWDNGLSKPRMYKTFQTEYKEENYVKVIKLRSHRSALAKFRMVVSPIRTETGRYEQLSEDRRTMSQLCKRSQIWRSCFTGLSYL